MTEFSALFWSFVHCFFYYRCGECSCAIRCKCATTGTNSRRSSPSTIVFPSLLSNVVFMFCSWFAETMSFKCHFIYASKLFNMTLMCALHRAELLQTRNCKSEIDRLVHINNNETFSIYIQFLNHFPRCIPEV